MQLSYLCFEKIMIQELLWFIMIINARGNVKQKSLN